MAVIDQEPAAKKGPSLIIQLAVLLAMTGVAIGGGWFAGGYMRGSQPSMPSKTESPVGAEPGHDAGAAGANEAAGDRAAPAQLTIVPLAPITTNLAQPADTWVRMELSLVFDNAPEDPGLADAIHQDLITYVRTLKLHQIEGASGFLHLRTDLEERARLRSQGTVKRVLIRTFLLE
ncbi:flagellar basal body-associated FliL family protein [Arvimicrobium flavum]|uniref:flagellar basal body-associated FliL family protein n=1 Tax=Arvimicrobium flavum TaxID=3393320 RepID=UPI00237B5245|nr:flagellar basal body-associated FliL family protein [Mesorhizobium shangrilense]